MNIQEVKRKLGIDNKDIAEFFGYSTVHSYQNSQKSKERTEKGIVKIYQRAIKSVGKKNMVEQSQANDEDAQT